MSNFNESFNKKIRIELSEQKGGVALSPAQIKNAVEAAAKAGAGIVKLVGQDPVRYSGLKALVKDIKRTEGIFEVSLTTDGHGLGDAAKGLAAAGLDRVNINVDTLKYSKYTGGGELDDIVTAINAATDAGLKPVKLNILLKKDYSEDEIMDFVQLTLQHQYEIRFIEMTEEEEAEEFSDEEPEDGSHQVDIVQGNEFNIELDHEDGRYQTGETAERRFRIRVTVLRMYINIQERWEKFAL